MNIIGTVTGFVSVITTMVLKTLIYLSNKPMAAGRSTTLDIRKDSDYMARKVTYPIIMAIWM